MEKFRNKYRIASARLQNWNYGFPGMYFITICTKNRKCYFGEIINAEMILNNLGLVAQDEWAKTPMIRPDMNLELGEFVVMPNHFHGIIVIGENDFNSGHHHRRDAMHGVPTMHDDAAENRPANQPQNQFGPQSKNLASVIRGFKSAVTTFARKNNIAFDWQERFHDHIIRNHEEYLRIAAYIINNPENWKGDKFFN